MAFLLQMMVNAGRENEAWVRVPDPDASVEDVLEFAGTYDAYAFFADQPDQLQRLLGAVYDEIARSLVVPDWVRLDLARAVLFYAYRMDYFAGGGGPYEPMGALVSCIRHLSGGWVMLRTQPSPTSSGTFSATTGSATLGEFEDSWEYSDDRMYRWWYERRWDARPTLCFVGLNPATGDTDGKPRPTLAKVVNWARREGCGAVVVVNLFAYRATNPRELFTARLDIVGEGNDEVIRQQPAAASITLAAWGAHRLARPRAVDVLPMLTSAQCVGVTKSGAPAHPLYVPSATRLRPYP